MHELVGLRSQASQVLAADTKRSSDSRVLLFFLFRTRALSRRPKHWWKILPSGQTSGLFRAANAVSSQVKWNDEYDRDLVVILEQTTVPHSGKGSIRDTMSITDVFGSSLNKNRAIRRIRGEKQHSPLSISQTRRRLCSSPGLDQNETVVRRAP